MLMRLTIRTLLTRRRTVPTTLGAGLPSKHGLTASLCVFTLGMLGRPMNSRRSPVEVPAAVPKPVPFPAAACRATPRPQGRVRIRWGRIRSQNAGVAGSMPAPAIAQSLPLRSVANAVVAASAGEPVPSRCQIQLGTATTAGRIRLGAQQTATTDSALANAPHECLVSCRVGAHAHGRATVDV